MVNVNLGNIEKQPNTAIAALKQKISKMERLFFFTYRDSLPYYKKESLYNAVHFLIFICRKHAIFVENSACVCWLTFYSFSNYIEQ